MRRSWRGVFKLSAATPAALCLHVRTVSQWTLTLFKILWAACQTCQGPPITSHGLRHTHISHLLMDGVHVKIVGERAGHANVTTTLNVYAAYVPNMQADVALRWTRGFAKG